MAPREKIDFIYLYFTYVPAKETEKYNAVFRQTGNHQLSGHLYKYKSWLDPIAFYEKRKITNDVPTCYTEYRINSNNKELFTIGEKKFDKILVVLGEHAVYWQFFMEEGKKNIQGKGKIPLTYCVCCIRTQYEDILKNIKNHIQNKHKTNKN